MGLSERRNRILSAVVTDYVQTAEPVGSETLAFKYNFGVRSATIRNELAAMSELGYLRQPHTSAGRVPSDLGYRYYVDQLMPPPALDSEETSRARRSYSPHDSEVEHILQQTCRILAGLTRCASIATPPQVDTISIKHVALSAVGHGKILVVTVLNTGHIDNRVVDYIGEISTIDLITMANLVNERLQGAELSHFSKLAGMELPQDLLKLRPLYRKITSIARQALSSAMDDELYMDGTANIVKQPEFSHGEKLAGILEALEHRKCVFQILSSTLLGRDVTVIIGAENQFAELSECSFVASHYRVGDRICGSIAVVGPTRMDYRRAVAAVEFMALNLSQMLTQMSLG